MAATLVITTEDGVAIALQLGSLPVAIGRSEENTLQIDDRRMSRRHVVVRRLDTGLYELEDLGSQNGSVINGQAMTPGQRVVLQPGDVLTFGGVSVEVRAERLVEEQLAFELVDDLRAQVNDLVEQQAALRQEVRDASEAKVEAQRARDDEHEEAARLREAMVAEQKKVGELTARMEVLGTELRNQRAAAPAPGAGPALASEAAAKLQKEADRHRARAVELEARESDLVQRGEELKKEVERLQERCRKHEARETDLTNAVKPALMRVAELTKEVERLRIELTKR